MVGEPGHGLAGVAHLGGGDGVVADDSVLLEFVHGLGFIETGGGEVVLEAVGFQSLVNEVSWALRPSSACQVFGAITR